MNINFSQHSMQCLKVLHYIYIPHRITQTVADVYVCPQANVVAVRYVSKFIYYYDIDDVPRGLSNDLDKVRLFVRLNSAYLRDLTDSDTDKLTPVSKECDNMNNRIDELYSEKLFPYPDFEIFQQVDGLHVTTKKGLHMRFDITTGEWLETLAGGKYKKLVTFVKKNIKVWLDQNIILIESFSDY